MPLAGEQSVASPATSGFPLHNNRDTVQVTPQYLSAVLVTSDAGESLEYQASPKRRVISGATGSPDTDGSFRHPIFVHNRLV